MKRETMARLDDLIAQIGDQALRQEMEDALATYKRSQRFGLVYEEHIPEITALFGLPIQGYSQGTCNFRT